MDEEAPKKPAKTEQDWQDDLDNLLRRARAAGMRTEKMLARASMKRGVSVVEGLTDMVFDALEGRKKGGAK